MAVVTQYGNGYKNPAAASLVHPVFAEARVRAITSLVPVANGDSANSRHYFGKVPSHAIVLPRSTLHHSAITGLNSYHIGLELDGAVVDNDVLATALDLTVAGTKSGVAAVTVANLFKPLWQLLGLTSDPGKVYDLVGLMNAAAAANGSIHGEFYFAQK